MKNTLSLIKAAAVEMLQTRKARVLFRGAFVGAFVAGALAMVGLPNSGIAIGVGTAVGRALWETGVIYHRLKREQQFNHG